MTDLGTVQERKVSTPRRKSNSHIRVVQPVASSLQWLSCNASLSHPVILKPTVNSNNIPIHNYRGIPDCCSSRRLLSCSYSQQIHVCLLNCPNRNLRISWISLYSVFLRRTQRYRYTHSFVPELVTLHIFILKKLIVDFLVKEFLIFCRVGRFINEFISSNDV